MGSPMKTLQDAEPLIQRLVRRYKNKFGPHCSEDDILSAARTGAWLAITKPTEHSNFEGYLYLKIDGAIRDELRMQRFQKRSRHGANARIVYDYPLEETHGYEQDHNTAIDFAKFVANLSPRHKQILKAQINGDQIKAAAKELGIGGPRGCQILREIRENITDFLEVEVTNYS